MTVRVDSEQKKVFDALCEEFGMSANTAINVFIRAVNRNRGIPFNITGSRPDPIREEAMEAFKALRAAAEASTEPEMTLDEINAEIDAARKEMAEKQEDSKRRIAS